MKLADGNWIPCSIKYDGMLVEELLVFVGGIFDRWDRSRQLVDETMKLSNDNWLRLAGKLPRVESFEKEFFLILKINFFSIFLR